MGISSEACLCRVRSGTIGYVPWEALHGIHPAAIDAFSAIAVAWALSTGLDPFDVLPAMYQNMDAVLRFAAEQEAARMFPGQEVNLSHAASIAQINGWLRLPQVQPFTRALLVSCACTPLWTLTSPLCHAPSLASRQCLM